MREKFVLLKHRLSPLLSKLQFIKDRVKALIPEKKPHSEKYYKRIA